MQARSIKKVGQLSRRQLVGCATMLAAPGVSLTALAQSRDAYPNRVVRVIVPYGAGGPVDGLMRTLSSRLSDKWRQSVIVENKVGASGAIGVKEVIKAKPDGYTLLGCWAGEISVLPVASNPPPFDPLTDLELISQIVAGPMVLAVTPDQPFKTLADMIAYAAKNPGKVSYGSIGTGSGTHLTGEMLDRVANIKTLHVPYKGASAVIPDLLGGQIHMAFLGISVALPLLNAGKLIPLAVSTVSRSSMLPNVPAVAEAFPGFEFDSWYGLAAPRDTPKDIVNTIQQDVAGILRDPEYAASLKKLGSEIVGSTPAAFRQKIERERKQYILSASKLSG